jgi:hypothetical protein
MKRKLIDFLFFVFRALEEEEEEEDETEASMKTPYVFVNTKNDYEKLM